MNQSNKVAKFFILMLCLICIILVILNLIIDTGYIFNSILPILFGVIFILQSKYTFSKNSKFIRFFLIAIGLLNIFIGIKSFIIHM